MYYAYKKRIYCFDKIETKFPSKVKKKYYICDIKHVSNYIIMGSLGALLN